MASLTEPNGDDHEAVRLLSFHSHSSSSSIREADTASDDGRPWRESSFDFQHEPEPKDLEVLDLQDPLSEPSSPVWGFIRVWDYIRPRIVPLLVFLAPSFITSIFMTSKAPATKLRSTAYLDGLRGVAAYIVFNTHMVGVVNRTIAAGYEPGDEGSYWIQLPIIRLIYSGFPAVCIFFVVSGFALSIGPVKDMNQTNPQASLRGLSSSIFRRPIRLLLPCYASTFVVFLLVRFGLFKACAAHMRNKTILAGFPYLADWPTRTPSIFTQFLDLWGQNILPFNFFHTDADDYFSNRYNPVLWTIALEFRGSLILYLTHAAVYFLRRPYRVGITMAIIFVSIFFMSFELPLFWCGYLLAELDFWQKSTKTSQPGPFDEQQAKKARGGKVIFFSTVLLVACYLASDSPWEPEKSYFYAGLTALTPSFYFLSARLWISMGAVMMVLAIGQLSLVVKVFTTSPIQYLGRISFSLYLMHIVIVRGVGILIFYKIYQHTAQTGSATTAFMGFLAAYTIVLAICIWLADIFCRAVDEPCVWLGKTLVQRMFRDDKAAAAAAS